MHVAGILPLLLPLSLILITLKYLPFNKVHHSTDPKVKNLHMMRDISRVNNSVVNKFTGERRIGKLDILTKKIVWNRKFAHHRKLCD